LPRQDFPASERTLPLRIIDMADESRSPLTISIPRAHADRRTRAPEQLRIRPANLEDLFLELTGKECERDQAPAAVWHARNLEFVRDRSTLFFTLLLPIALVVGMSFVFGGRERRFSRSGSLRQSSTTGPPFLSERYVEFVPVTDQAAGVQKVTHQQIDLLLDSAWRPALLGQQPTRRRVHRREAAAARSGAHRNR